MANPQLRAHIPQALLDRVDAEAERRGMTRTQFVVQALSAALEAPQADDLAGRVDALERRLDALEDK